MKRLYLLLSIALLLSPFYVQAQRNCSSMEVLDQQLQQDPEMAQRMRDIETHTQRYIEQHQGNITRNVITIPVVVHVVYNGSTQNISDAQINSQITVLNDDFRRMNADASNTPSDFAGVAADTEIQFCLASVDPDGNATNGILRVPTTRTSFGTNDAVKFASSGGSDAWPADSYMNFWVCVIGGGILGYAQFPGGSADTDGIVVDYRYFGTTGTATAPFNLGRTATHEVGHWLNLRHIWGDGGCNVDDFVADTPPAGGPNYTGEPCTYPGPNSCRPRGRNGGNDLPDMFQNYMDYSDDACMNLFTVGQKDRMQAALSGPRSGLLISNGCGNGATPTCNDGVQNGDETGVDCGGSCPDVCPPPTACAAPTGVSASRAGNGRSVTVSWNAVSGANSYEVDIRQQGASSWQTFTSTSTSIGISGLNKRRTYESRVRAICNGNPSDYSSTVSFREDGAASARGGAIDGPYAIYPNPASDIVTIEFGQIESKSVNVSVVDMMGRTLKAYRNFSVSETYLDISTVGMKEGVYFIRIDDGQSFRELQKLVIAR